MVVDASVLTAFLVEEPDAKDLAMTMERYPRRCTSPLAVWEASVAVARILEIDVTIAFSAVEEYLKLASIVVVDLPAQARFLAIDAFARFGKGRHPAALNFGDCFIYALAAHLREPLLFKGADFACTDIEAA